VYYTIAFLQITEQQVIYNNKPDPFSFPRYEFPSFTHIHTHFPFPFCFGLGSCFDAIAITFQVSPFAISITLWHSDPMLILFQSYLPPILYPTLPSPSPSPCWIPLQNLINTPPWFDIAIKLTQAYGLWLHPQI
jgi:hypothetical protein